MKDSTRLFFMISLVAALLLLGVYSPLPLCAADPPVGFPPAAGAVGSKTLLNSAIDKYNDGNYRESLDELVAVLKTPLSVEDKILALQYLGFVHMAYNREREAGIAFEDAIRLNPALTLDPAAVSPKILEVFRRAKSRVVKMGALVITTSPPDAEVFVDGNVVGRTPLNNREILMGRHKIRVMRENHAAVEQEVEIRENAETVLNFNLVLNAGTLSVATEPPGVTVYVDEVAQGKTPINIKNIVEGERTITLRGEGLDEYSDKLVFKPGVILSMEVKLVESSGMAVIRSLPSGAEVFFDGKLKGKTPLTLERAPSGKHNLLLLKSGLGQWVGEIEVRRGQTTELTGKLRPSLAVIPPLVRDGYPPESAQEAERAGRFLAGLKDIEGLNVFYYDKKKNPNLFRELGIFPLELAQKSSRESLNPERVVSSLQALAREMKADLILLGVYKDKQKTEVTWNLFNLYHAVPDTFDFKISSEEKDLKLFRQRFQYNWRLESPWLGLLAVETWLSPQPLVIEVRPGGPAARAGVEPGDALTGVNQQRIKSYQELQDIIAKQPIGEEVMLEVNRKNILLGKRIRLEGAFGELPLDDPRILYNLAMVELKRLEETATAEAVREAARLNLALAYMHFREWERAADMLAALKFTSQEGLCLGTALFRLGQCYEALEQRSKAVEAYKKAQNHPRCTLINPDGPLAMQEASIRLSFLTQKGRAQ